MTSQIEKGAHFARSHTDPERLGVKRVSIGGSLSAAVLAFVQNTMKVLQERGPFGYAQTALPNAHINAVMDKYRLE